MGSKVMRNWTPADELWDCLKAMNIAGCKHTQELVRYDMLRVRILHTKCMSPVEIAENLSKDRQRRKIFRKLPDVNLDLLSKYVCVIHEDLGLKPYSSERTKDTSSFDSIYGKVIKI